MKLTMIFFKVILLTGIFLVSPSVLAFSYFDSHASALLTIDQVHNITNPGSSTSLSITGDVYVSNDSYTEFGNAATSQSGMALLDSSNASPGLIDLSSDVHGNTYAIPTGSLADRIYSLNGEFNLQNLSTTDSVKIDFSLLFNIGSNAALNDFYNENAFSEAFVILYDSLGQITFNKTVSADAKGILGPSNDSLSDTLLFSIILQPDTLDTSNLSFNYLALNVSARGNSESIPEPETLLLILGGIVAMRKVNQS
jgi:hypothetical protein